MDGKIAVLLDAKLHNEIVLRTRKSDDVSRIIHNVLEDFLERTAGDDGLWSQEYCEELIEREADDQLVKYGPPSGGYHWQILFLQNGTQLKITYKGRDYFAEIRHGKLIDGKIERSPSEWARVVAANTNRNAWRDIGLRRSMLTSGCWRTFFVKMRSLTKSTYKR